METKSVYGWGTSGNGIDTHLMKNIEWGAITYLSKSIYGKTDEIWVNNSQAYITGCAGNSVTDSAYNGCQNAYNTTNGVKASVTGTVYGIYDMVGGAWERAAAYLDNSNSALNNGSSIINALSKYKDVYTKGTIDDQESNYYLTINKKGDAIYETSNLYMGSAAWNTDYSSIPYSIYPWFYRGGRFNDGVGTGSFAFYYYDGGTDSSHSFRPVLLVGSGL
jgi:hypothetical protein